MSDININLLSDCCRRVIVHYNNNLTQVYEQKPNIFQVYEIQEEPHNDRPYYIGTVDYTVAIGFWAWSTWVISPKSHRSVRLMLYPYEYLL